MADDRFVRFKGRDGKTSDARRAARQDDGVVLRKCKRGNKVWERRQAIDAARREALGSGLPGLPRLPGLPGLPGAAAAAAPDVFAADPPSPLAWDTLPLVPKPRLGALTDAEVDDVRVLVSRGGFPEGAVTLLCGAGWIATLAIDAGASPTPHRAVSLLASLAQVCPSAPGMAEADPAIVAGLLGAAMRPDLYEGVVALAMHGLACYMHRRHLKTQMLPICEDAVFAMLTERLATSTESSVVCETAMVVQQLMRTDLIDPADGALVGIPLELLLPLVDACRIGADRAVVNMLGGRRDQAMAAVGTLEVLATYAMLETDVRRALRMLGPAMAVIANAAAIDDVMELILPALLAIEGAAASMPLFLRMYVLVDGLLPQLYGAIGAGAHFSETSAISATHVLHALVSQCPDTVAPTILHDGGMRAAMSLWPIGAAVRENLLELWCALVRHLDAATVAEQMRAEDGIGVRACKMLAKNEAAEAAAALLLTADAAVGGTTILDELEHAAGPKWIDQAFRLWHNMPKVEELTERLLRRDDGVDPDE